MLTPRLDILPAAQARLWPELRATPAGFVLYGGTALALRLGHRVSADFDFFSARPFVPTELAARIPYLRDAPLVHAAANTLTCRVDRDGDVLVSFFGGLALRRVRPPERVAGPGIAVASLLDLAATKVKVVLDRASAKDYQDIDALLAAGLDLPTMLAAARRVYGPAFDPLISLKALSYFGDGDLPSLPAALQERLIQAVRAVDPARLPPLPPRRRPTTPVRDDHDNAR